MTADPHIETLVDAVNQVIGWADVRCPKEQYMEGIAALDALAARLEAAERDLADARKAMEFLANETLFGSIVAEYAQKKIAAAQQPPAEEPDG